MYDTNNIVFNCFNHSLQDFVFHFSEKNTILNFYIGLIDGKLENK